VQVIYSPEFGEWLDTLKDRQSQARIAARVVRVREGNIGQTRSLGQGLSEMKVDHGPGYRVYFTIEAGTIMILLCGGDKSTQRRDIARARRMLEARDWLK
jgi:putative addiction module killer protein